MRTKRVKRIKLLKGEKFMFFLVVLFGFIIMPTSFVYTKALLSKSNIRLENIQSKIEDQNNRNEALGMQIDELDIASLSGLSYNNNNIKTYSD